MIDGIESIIKLQYNKIKWNEKNTWNEWIFCTAYGLDLIFKRLLETMYNNWLNSIGLWWNIWSNIYNLMIIK